MKGVLIMSKKLEDILNNLDIIKNCFPEEVCLVVADKEKIIGYLPGETLQLRGVEVGKILDKTGPGSKSVTVQTVIDGKYRREEKGPEVYGISYVATGTPIYEDGKLVGVLTALVSNERLDVLRKGAQELNYVVQEMSSSMEEINKSTENVSSGLQELVKQSAVIREDIQQVYKILKFVREVAGKSQILGLNASIEAARAGENGRGFSVVAKEIQNMGISSKQSSEEIQRQLDKVQQNMDRINQFIQEIATYTEEHSAQTQTFTTAFEQIVSTAGELEKLT